MMKMNQEPNKIIPEPTFAQINDALKKEVLGSYVHILDRLKDELAQVRQRELDLVQYITYYENIEEEKRKYEGK